MEISVCFIYLSEINIFSCTVCPRSLYPFCIVTYNIKLYTNLWHPILSTQLLSKVLKNQTIMFILMVLVGMAFNPMNVLAYRLNDLYVSYTLFYGGLLMASNMIWAHEVVHYLAMNHINI